MTSTLAILNLKSRRPTMQSRVLDAVRRALAGRKPRGESGPSDYDRAWWSQVVNERAADSCLAGESGPHPADRGRPTIGGRRQPE